MCLTTKETCFSAKHTMSQTAVKSFYGKEVMI